jgi:hypothetical protein
MIGGEEDRNGNYVKVKTLHFAFHSQFLTSATYSRIREIMLFACPLPLSSIEQPVVLSARPENRRASVLGSFEDESVKI